MKWEITIHEFQHQEEPKETRLPPEDSEELAMKAGEMAILEMPGGAEFLGHWYVVPNGRLEVDWTRPGTLGGRVYIRKA